MGEVKHTAGPWVVEDGWLQREEGPCVDGRYFSICVTATSIADISLLTSAPELLTEAKRAADQLDFVLGTLRSLKWAGYEVSATVIAETEEIMDACYAAIAKATGETK